MADKKALKDVKVGDKVSLTVYQDTNTYTVRGVTTIDGEKWAQLDDTIWYRLEYLRPPLKFKDDEDS